MPLCSAATQQQSAEYEFCFHQLRKSGPSDPHVPVWVTSASEDVMPATPGLHPEAACRRTKEHRLPLLTQSRRKLTEPRSTAVSHRADVPRHGRSDCVFFLCAPFDRSAEQILLHCNQIVEAHGNERSVLGDHRASPSLSTSARCRSTPMMHRCLNRTIFRRLVAFNPGALCFVV